MILSELMDFERRMRFKRFACFIQTEDGMHCWYGVDSWSIFFRIIKSLLIDRYRSVKALPDLLYFKLISYIITHKED